MEDDATRSEPGRPDLLGELRELQYRALRVDGPVYDALMAQIAALRLRIESEEERAAAGLVEAEIVRLQEKLDTATDADIKAALQQALEERRARLAELRSAEAEEDATPDAPPREQTPEEQLEVESLLQQAQVAKMRKQPQEATKALQRALEVAPQSPHVLELLGDDQMEQRKYKAARDTYRKAVRLDPNNVGLERKLAAVALKLEEADLLIFGQSLEASESAASGKASVLLSAVVPGLGQMAGGRALIGGIMLGGFLLFAVVAWLMLGGDAGRRGTNYTFLLPAALAAGFWLWSVSDSSSRAKAAGKRSIDRPRPPMNLPFE